MSDEKKLKPKSVSKVKIESKPKTDSNKPKRVIDMNTTEILLGEPLEEPINFQEEMQFGGSREEYLDKIIKENFSTENIEVRSDLNTKQILVLSRAKIYASHFGLGIVESFCNNIMTLSLSKDRKSRGELVQLSKGHLGGFDPIGFEQDPSISRRLLGS